MSKELRKVAVLDDYQHVAAKCADWSLLDGRAEVTYFHDHVRDEGELVKRLAPFEVISVMRERTPLPRSVLARLPQLKLISSTGPRNPSIDADAAREFGIQVVNTGYTSAPTIEFASAMLLAVARNIPQESASLRSGGWQTGLGADLGGKVLGLLGLGNVGSGVAKVGLALGMEVVAWSQNLSQERAQQVGIRAVTKEELFRSADFLSIHLVLSARTLGLVGATELGWMKRSARLINTSRGPIVNEEALVQALESGVIAGAAIDVFESEPLPADHPFRRLQNVLATPHIGYVSEGLYRTFYGDTVANIDRWFQQSV